MDRLRLSATARNQLVALKRRTGFEHNNVLCRHALCLSLANASTPPDEDFNFAGGIEIEWRVLTGGQDALYYNLLMVRLLEEGIAPIEDAVRKAALMHVHRGLSYLMSRQEKDLLGELASAVVLVR
ncbi:DNA sulfur modification protein DndE [uncultured Xylophilus sp.]|uniref:DNA sulfur modification protein DndE n=1 Tax=uncultured Xylophilus sp. TaxID=296832 RepID=UPI0025E5DFA3|nr:DNA sulfur modification protein DndE [uncultured Xylophilus sp.]